MSTTDTIRNTIAKVVVAIDQKDWSSLSAFFTDDVELTFPEPIGVHTSISTFEKTLQSFLKDFSTQHCLTTQTIDLHGDTAKAITYVTTVVDRPGQDGGAQTQLGSYEDELLKDQANGEERWRIRKRTVSSFPW